MVYCLINLFNCRLEFLTCLYQGKYEIGLDEVEKLGYFIEIENKKYEKSILEEYDELISVASNLNINLNNITKKGYPHILLEEKIQG